MLAGFMFFTLCVSAFVLLMVASLWIIFTKAGKPGWAAIVPIYNLLVKLEVCGRPWWWIFLCLIPVANLVIWVILSIDLAKAFGKSDAFGIGLAFLPFVFHPILAFGSAKYQGRVAPPALEPAR